MFVGKSVCDTSVAMILVRLHIFPHMYTHIVYVLICILEKHEYIEHINMIELINAYTNTLLVLYQYMLVYTFISIHKK